ncbi:hypothetical protein JCM19235_1930 [Vibrio maritimus]|uniref:Phosphoadenosine phosphosulphate reductase domain-containing protein n=1 Tax=Vibrio maritimus TaxID=990268 RepID=A0A090SGC6_9VIBR|nr:hypothetical protein JCM19235_1930 [Vibrio maritimus]
MNNSVLKQRQSLDLDAKIALTKKRVKEWCDEYDFDVFLGDSGGKDSMVLDHIIWSMGGMYRKIPRVFSNTGLEMPEIKDFARNKANLGRVFVEVKPPKNFKEVWDIEGMPLVSKKWAKSIRILAEGWQPERANMYRLYDEGINRNGQEAPRWKLPKRYRPLITSGLKFSEKCCDWLKKKPLRDYAKQTGRKPFSGMMADEGGFREEKVEQCNAYDGKNPMSSPLLFWLEEDIWEYIERFEVEICHVYYGRRFVDGEMVACDAPSSDLPNTDEITEGTFIPGERRTGCMFCGFGAQLEKAPNRFQRMEITHPRQHKVIIDRMGMGEALKLIDVKVNYEHD